MHPNTIVINDSNWASESKTPNDQSRGYEGMWRDGCAAPKEFGELGIPLVAQDEWVERVEEQEQRRSNLYHFSREMSLSCLDQNGTNYCWINGPVHAMEIERMKETGQVVSLSPASAGARIKSFRNVGGWGSEGLEWMLKHGVNETKDWPANAIDRRYSTNENHEKAKRNLIKEYFILRSWEEVVSCILANIAVAVGYNWWRHEVTGTHLVPAGRRDVDLGIRNSWGMQWGDKGFGVLQGSKKYPDDAVAVSSIMAM